MAAEPGSADFEAALRAVEQLSPELVGQADEVVRLYEAASGQKMACLRWIQTLSFAGALVLLAVDSWAMQRYVLRPLGALSDAAERIGRGNLDASVNIAGPREIKHLAGNLDAMRAQLKESRQDLVAWTEELETRVVQRTRELAALHEVSWEISSRLEIDHVLRSGTEKARALLGGKGALLCLLDEAGEGLHLSAADGSPAAVVRTQTTARRAPVGQALTGDRAVLCGTECCPEGCGILAALFRTSHLVAPLRVGERVIGALCVGSSKAEAFSDESAVLLTELANSAAIALENARLYQQAERLAALAADLETPLLLPAGVTEQVLCVAREALLNAGRHAQAGQTAAIVVMLTVRDEDEKLFEAIRSGAQGYLLKSIRSPEMLDLLRRAVQGEAAITPALAGRMLEEFRRLSQRPPAAPDEESVTLTHREQKVLGLAAEGAMDKEIAGALTISIHTVKSHVRNILAKLHVSSRYQAAQYERDRGLV